MGLLDSKVLYNKSWEEVSRESFSNDELNEIEEIKKQLDEIMVHTAGIVSAEPAMEAAEAMEAVETTEENA